MPLHRTYLATTLSPHSTFDIHKFQVLKKKSQEA